MRAGGISGEILPWRDVLHEGPVPADLSLSELSRVRAEWLAKVGFATPGEVERDFMDRDDLLRRYCDFDEVILWFEWDLYDQLQLLQILDFFSSSTRQDREETSTRLSIVDFEGYLGTLPPERFAALLETRRDVTDSMLGHAHAAWKAFRSADPLELNSMSGIEDAELPFLPLALSRHLEEFPSTLNGLSRSESQILEAVAQRAASFHDIFQACSNREERIFCGDSILAMYIERMSQGDNALIRYTSGELIDAPRTEDDSRAFRNSEMGLTRKGRSVLACEEDWIALGGSDRWLGGVRIEGVTAPWRWNPDTRKVEKAA
jgi:hypothetical protein